MKVLLDVPDVKAPSLMDVLQHISYVTVSPIAEGKDFLLTEIKDAVEEMKLIKTGKRTARNVRDFLNEL